MPPRPVTTKLLPRLAGAQRSAIKLVASTTSIWGMLGLEGWISPSMFSCPLALMILSADWNSARPRSFRG